MTLRLLIDECLSPELVRMAVQAGHVESTCVRDRGWTGTKDWKLITHVIEGDYTLVTCNSVDFRGRGPGKLGGEYARQAIHAGLICLNSARVLDLGRQLTLFQLALNELASIENLVNQAFDMFEMEDGTVRVEIYDIPEAD